MICVEDIKGIVEVGSKAFGSQDDGMKVQKEE